MSTVGDNMASPEGSAAGQQRTQGPRIPLDPSRVPEDLKNIAHIFSTDVDRYFENDDDFEPATATVDNLNDYTFMPSSENMPKSAEVSNHVAVKDQCAVKLNSQLRQTQGIITPSAHVVKITDEQDDSIVSGNSGTLRTKDPGGSSRILKSRQMMERSKIASTSRMVPEPQRNFCANAHVCSKLLGSSHKNKLQTAVKAVNDIPDSDKLAATMLVFGAYSRISTSCLPALSNQKSLTVSDTAMAHFHKWRSKSASHKALCRHECLDISTVRTLPICAPIA
ncbi:hypothetical protein SEPCBS119000_005280 [Sporothrix epigloea]|uniref:Uncharacterized protein n=1 Tax=Sporothrix epigloea TaxID=1892477 RepID=A0ABP0DWR3_9PEZI